jgi:hypothetical protein
MGCSEEQIRAAREQASANADRVEPLLDFTLQRHALGLTLR